MIRKGIVLLAGLCLGAVLYGAYGLKFDPVQNLKEAAQASFVPLNSSVYRLRQPDGVERLFVRDAEEPNLLEGESPWLAELDGAKALVMTDPDFKGGQTGFLFVNGYLRQLLVDGKEFKIPPTPVAKSADGLARLWPAPGKRLVADAAPDIWKDGERLRLWFDNPNKAGVLFAELALAALALLFLRPPGLKILGGVLFLPAFAGLAATSSRGAFLSLLCGLGVMALTRFKALFGSWRRLAVLVCVAMIAVGSLFALGQFDRLGKKLFDEGQRETSRLTVWREVPRMMVDAPGGWGHGKSARAYIDWYQKNSDCLLKDMISGHLTFLVESGWAMRFAYLFLWAAVLLLSVWLAFTGASPVPAAVVTAFGVSACFNPVIGVAELWVVPLVAAASLLVVRRAELARLWKLPVALAGAGAVCVLAGIAVAGSLMQGDFRVKKCGGAVWLKGEKPAVWLVDDDYVVHGGYWWMAGRNLRAYLGAKAEARPVGRAETVQDLPPEIDTLVLAGEAGRAFLDLPKRPKVAHLVFLSPPFGWPSVPEDLLKACDVKLVAGSLAVRFQELPAERPEWVRIVPGAELYVPDWMAYLK